MAFYAGINTILKDSAAAPNGDISEHIAATSKRIKTLEATIPAVTVWKKYKQKKNIDEQDIDQIIEDQMRVRRQAQSKKENAIDDLIPKKAILNAVDSMRKLEYLILQERLIKKRINDLERKEHAYKNVLRNVIVNRVKPCIQKIKNLPAELKNSCNCQTCKCEICMQTDNFLAAGKKIEEEKQKRLAMLEKQRRDKFESEMRAEEQMKLNEFRVRKLLNEQKKDKDDYKCIEGCWSRDIDEIAFKISSAVNSLTKDYTNIDESLLETLKEISETVTTASKVIKLREKHRQNNANTTKSQQFTDTFIKQDQLTDELPTKGPHLCSVVDYARKMKFCEKPPPPPPPKCCRSCKSCSTVCFSSFSEKNSVELHGCGMKDMQNPISKCSIGQLSCHTPSCCEGGCLTSSCKLPATPYCDIKIDETCSHAKTSTTEYTQSDFSCVRDVTGCNRPPIHECSPLQLDTRSKLCCQKNLSLPKFKIQCNDPAQHINLSCTTRSCNIPKNDIQNQKPRKCKGTAKLGKCKPPKKCFRNKMNKRNGEDLEPSGCDGNTQIPSGCHRISPLNESGCQIPSGCHDKLATNDYKKLSGCHGIPSSTDNIKPGCHNKTPKANQRDDVPSGCHEKLVTNDNKKLSGCHGIPYSTDNIKPSGCHSKIPKANQRDDLPSGCHEKLVTNDNKKLSGCHGIPSSADNIKPSGCHSKTPKDNERDQVPSGCHDKLATTDIIKLSGCHGRSSSSDNRKPPNCHRKILMDNQRNQVPLGCLDKLPTNDTKKHSGCHDIPSSTDNIKPSGCLSKTPKDNERDQVPSGCHDKLATNDTKKLSGCHDTPSSSDNIKPSSCHSKIPMENQRDETSSGCHDKSATNVNYYVLPLVSSSKVPSDGFHSGNEENFELVSKFSNVNLENKSPSRSKLFRSGSKLRLKTVSWRSLVRTHAKGKKKSSKHDCCSTQECMKNNCAQTLKSGLNPVLLTNFDRIYNMLKKKERDRQPDPGDVECKCKVCECSPACYGYIIVYNNELAYRYRKRYDNCTKCHCGRCRCNILCQTMLLQDMARQFPCSDSNLYLFRKLRVLKKQIDMELSQELSRSTLYSKSSNANVDSEFADLDDPAVYDYDLHPRPPPTTTKPVSHKSESFDWHKQFEYYKSLENPVPKKHNIEVSILKGSSTSQDLKTETLSSDLSTPKGASTSKDLKTETLNREMSTVKGASTSQDLKTETLSSDLSTLKGTSTSQDLKTETLNIDLSTPKGTSTSQDLKTETLNREMSTVKGASTSQDLGTEKLSSDLSTLKGASTSQDVKTKTLNREMSTVKRASTSQDLKTKTLNSKLLRAQPYKPIQSSDENYKFSYKDFNSSSASNLGQSKTTADPAIKIRQKPDTKPKNSIEPTSEHRYQSYVDITPILTSLLDYQSTSTDPAIKKEEKPNTQANTKSRTPSNVEAAVRLRMFHSSSDDSFNCPEFNGNNPPDLRKPSDKNFENAMENDSKTKLLKELKFNSKLHLLDESKMNSKMNISGFRTEINIPNTEFNDDIQNNEIPNTKSQITETQDTESQKDANEIRDGNLPAKGDKVIMRKIEVFRNKTLLNNNIHTSTNSSTTFNESPESTQNNLKFSKIITTYSDRKILCECINCACVCCPENCPPKNQKTTKKVNIKIILSYAGKGQKNTIKSIIPFNNLFKNNDTSKSYLGPCNCQTNLKTSRNHGNNCSCVYCLPKKCCATMVEYNTLPIVKTEEAQFNGISEIEQEIDHLEPELHDSLEDLHFGRICFCDTCKCGSKENCLEENETSIDFDDCKSLEENKYL